MANYTSGFLDAFLARSRLVDAGLWSNDGGGTFAVGQGAHSADLEWSNYSAVARTYDAASVYCMGGVEGRGFQGFSLFAPSVGGTVAATLRVNVSGQIELYHGNLGTLLGVTTGAPPIASNTTYYTLEFAYGAVAGVGNGRCEVRVNGLRLAELSTTNFTATGGHPAGTLNPTTAGGGLNWAVFGVPDRLIWGPFFSGNGSPIQYFWQKNGASLWATVATGAGVSFAEQSDFVGIRRKAWIYPNSVGNYTQSGVGSGTQNSNWVNGLGTYPASIADQPAGMDSDTTYLKNITNGSSVTADKISHRLVDLTSTATSIGWVQRTTWARLAQGTTGNIRGGLRSPSAGTPANTDFMDSNAAVGATYGVTSGFILSKFYAQMPYSVGGTTVWSPNSVGTAAGGATLRSEGVIEMLTGLA